MTKLTKDTPIDLLSKELQVLTFKAAQNLLDGASISVEQLEAQYQELPGKIANRLVASLRLPGEIAQDNTVLAQYTQGVWNNIRLWAYERTCSNRWLSWLALTRPPMVTIKMYQAIVYPHLGPIDPRLSRFRIFAQPSVELTDARGEVVDAS